MDSYIQSTSSVCLGPAERILVIRCDFDPGRWSQSDFEKLGIDFPPLLAGASGTRLAQYLAGRYASKLAFAALGIPFSQISIGPGRAPLWPPGVLGSITHTDNVAFCALARESAVVALGIDAEPVLADSVSREICDAVMSRVERGRIVDCGEDLSVSLTIVFSAKEAIFKALYPAAKCFFDFDAVELLLLNIACGEASWRLRLGLGSWQAGTVLYTRFSLGNGLVLSMARL